jgi:pimeloyl-ACP methyl ester carboxylesterase
LGEALRGEIPPGALYAGPAREDVLEVLADMARVLGPETFISQARAWGRRPDHQKTLRRWLLPTLIIGGAADSVVPPRRQEFTAELMPKGRFVRIEEAGHLPTLEAPEAVTEAMEDFLNEPLMLR